ncbi:MAG TPA: biopolymer transporter ExbD [Gemmatimonadales bacterium]|nr:biopolymer transporter ExbD [Gemmatimonadales bacterium]
MAISTAEAGKGKVNADINVTPMIDVMLVLLIIFMIVTPLIASGFKATMPVGNHLDSDKEKEDEVVLGIDVNGDYFLNMRPIALDQLEPQLQAIFATREKDKILYFKADQHVRYAKIQEAVEIARRTGVRVLAAVTEEKAPSGGILGGEE